MRPSTVPAGTCAPSLSRLITIWSRARPSARAGRQRAVDAARAQELLLGAAGRPRRSRACGCANRRSLTGGSVASAAAVATFSACWVARSASDRRAAFEAGRSVEDAAAFGLASFSGSASWRRTSAGSTFCGFGAA